MLKLCHPERSAKWCNSWWNVGAAIAGGAETILLAEDEEAVRKLAKTVLEEFGYTVIEASDGQEAVSKFTANRDRIDLLLFDIVMPRMNGREVYEKIGRAHV